VFPFDPSWRTSQPAAASTLSLASAWASQLLLFGSLGVFGAGKHSLADGFLCSRAGSEHLLDKNTLN